MNRDLQRTVDLAEKCITIIMRQLLPLMFTPVQTSTIITTGMKVNNITMEETTMEATTGVIMQVTMAFLHNLDQLALNLKPLATTQLIVVKVLLL